MKIMPLWERKVCMVLDSMNDIMERAGVQAVIVTDPYNIRYLCGFSGGEGYLYISKHSRVMYVDSRYTLWAESECHDCVVETTGLKQYEEVSERIVKEGIDSIALEGKHLTYNMFREISEALPCENITAVNDELDNMRTVKGEDEIELIEIAESIGDEAFEYILGEIKPGMTEKETALLIEMYMRSHGADALSFDVIAASGINSAKPHAVPSDKKICNGDFVVLDFGCKYHGYCSDMTRTIVVGKPDNKQTEIYNIVKRAQQAALDNIKAGMTGKEADAIARNVIEEEGYADCFGHGLGHGIGLYIHEMPRLSRLSDTVLESGMVVSVEPGIYIDGFGGVRIEDAVVIEDDGVRNLTKSSKELICI